MMKIISVIGARPQFIKCAPLSRELRKNHQEILVHTGQHYDPEMSDIFFQELGIPKPDYHLGVGSGSHAEQTGKMLEKIEEILVREQPDLVIVFGDTNSTLAGALASVKLHIPVAHVESGLRSYDRRMPEEINRVLTDHISSLLFCPTTTSSGNLAREGITQGVHIVGDVMVDALQFNQALAERKSGIINHLGLRDRNYIVLTVHRASNTDSRENMEEILSAVGNSGLTAVFPVHPRTRKNLIGYGIWNQLPPNILPAEPLGYLDMIHLMRHADKILTDSGGIQKEAYILGVPCITLRDTTEWVETLDGVWNVLVGSDVRKIQTELMKPSPKTRARTPFFGNGDTAERICRILREYEISNDLRLKGTMSD